MPKVRKPWRVWSQGQLTYHTSQLKAYDYTKPLLADGKSATIEHWETDKWRVYERLRPER